MWHYSKPFLFFNCFTWLHSSSDRWALKTFASEQDVGLYAVLMQLGYMPISIVTGLIVTFIGPILFQRSGDAVDHSRNANVHRMAWRITLTAMALSFIASILMIFSHQWIFQLLVASEYQAVSYLLPWMILAGGLFSSAQVLSLKMMSDMNTWSLLWPKLYTALVGILLNFGGAYIAGLEGAVFGMLAFSVVHFLWIGLLNRQPRIALGGDPI